MEENTFHHKAQLKILTCFEMEKKHTKFMSFASL